MAQINQPSTRAWWERRRPRRPREVGQVGVRARAVLIAVGVNADSHREIVGLDVATAEDGAGWLAFLR
ncbi:hypothetical protein GCM10010448_69770 [Streptomyces glomeratus]|uniref:Mutator family transposase n=1 Tax=Streptomyces glomeratus TaxID=284452 RepID=A0ABP6M4V1_9ACTN